VWVWCFCLRLASDLSCKRSSYDENYDMIEYAN
jgi:hypothetical protein